MSSDPAREAWAAWLRERMDKLEISVADLADACGTTKSTVQGWRRGSSPALAQSEALCRALKVSPARLVEASAGRAGVRSEKRTVGSPA